MILIDEYSPIHSHAGSNCWMRIVDGSCCETRYAWPENDQPMKLMATSTFKSGSCAFICGMFYLLLLCFLSYSFDSIFYLSILDEVGLHRIENTSENVKAVSLHLYAPPFDSCMYFDEISFCKFLNIKPTPSKRRIEARFSGLISAVIPDNFKFENP